MVRIDGIERSILQESGRNQEVWKFCGIQHTGDWKKKWLE
jgi:hypothetical protein